MSLVMPVLGRQAFLRRGPECRSVPVLVRPFYLLKAISPGMIPNFVVCESQLLPDVFMEELVGFGLTDFQEN